MRRLNEKMSIIKAFDLIERLGLLIFLKKGKDNMNVIETGFF